jgi:hypothetical protein
MLYSLEVIRQTTGPRHPVNIQATNIAVAWRLAAVDLGIRVTVPFVLTPIGTDELIEFIALVHEFGSPRGTLLAAIDEQLESLQQVTRRAGYFVSLLNPGCYEQYERQRFIDTLNDWGYFGQRTAPTWYTGAPWTT